MKHFHSFFPLTVARLQHQKTSQRPLYREVVLLQKLRSADYLRAQNDDLLLASVQLLGGRFELTQQDVVAVLQFVGRIVLGGAFGDGLPQLVQVVLQLFVLGFQLLPLWGRPNESPMPRHGTMNAAQ